MTKPRRGLTKYCARNPTPTCTKEDSKNVKQRKDCRYAKISKFENHTVQGFRMHLLKSSKVKVRPIESMRKPNPTVKRSVSNQVT